MRNTVIATLAAASLLLAACGEDNTAGQDAVAVGGTFTFYAPGGQTKVTYPQNERKPVKNFSGESLMDPEKTISLDDYKGQIVVLNAWGQWCAPCRSESDDLQEVQETISSKGGTVLGINVRDHSAEATRDFVTDNGISYPSIYDPPFKTAAALGGVPASVVPTTIVLDRQHRPAAVFVREITAKELMETVQPLLDEPLDGQ